MTTKIGVLDHGSLKAKQRELRHGFSTELTLRVHRGLSWYGRAEQEGDDVDVRFLLLWIAFNAAYASEIDADLGGDREQFKLFFRTLVQLDEGKRIYNLVWSRFPSEVRMLLDNRYVFAPFWAHQNGVPSTADWEDRLGRAKHKANTAMAAQDEESSSPLPESRLADVVVAPLVAKGTEAFLSELDKVTVEDLCNQAQAEAVVEPGNPVDFII